MGRDQERDALVDSVEEVPGSVAAWSQWMTAWSLHVVRVVMIENPIKSCNPYQSRTYLQ